MCTAIALMFLTFVIYCVSHATYFKYQYVRKYFSEKTYITYTSTYTSIYISTVIVGMLPTIFNIYIYI